ncbi:hypothetical protein, partial [Klebsiella pneumoniae]|uniref:hypothetical protein n=1 Tax=Klebsiella pneumoniae TaxID=573 RepID=UPI00210D6576
GPYAVLAGVSGYPQSYRDSPETLRQLPILTPLKQQIVLADVAEVKVVTGPSMLKTENARPTSWIYIDARDRCAFLAINSAQEIDRQLTPLLREYRS